MIGVLIGGSLAFVQMAIDHAPDAHEVVPLASVRGHSGFSRVGRRLDEALVHGETERDGLPRGPGIPVRGAWSRTVRLTPPAAPSPDIPLRTRATSDPELSTTTASTDPACASGVRAGPGLVLTAQPAG